MIGLRMCNRVIGVISTIILARLLVPQDFGLISLAATFQGLIETMSEFALDLALIRTKDASRTLYDSAWTFSVLRGLAVALVVFALSNEVAGYYGQPGLRDVMAWLAITALLQGFQNIGVVDFRKTMDFRKDFLFSVSGRILGTLVTIIVAIWLRSYWALVIGLIARVGALVMLSYVMHPYRPRFSIAGWSELFHFSKWISAYNVMIFLGNSCAAFTLGRVIGPASIGIYSLASEISSLPLTELSGPIRRALYPAFAQVMHGDRSKLGEAFTRGLAVTMCLTLPLTVLISLLAEPIVTVALGRNWLAAVPIVRILVIFASIELATQQVPQGLVVLGKIKPMTIATFGIVAFRVTAVVLLTRWWGLTGAAWAMVAASALQAPIFLRMAIRELGIDIGAMIQATWRTIIAIAAMVVFGLGFLELCRSMHMQDQIAAMLDAVASGALYLAVHLLLWTLSGKPEGVERDLLRLIGARLGTKLAFLRPSGPVSGRS